MVEETSPDKEEQDELNEEIGRDPEDVIDIERHRKESGKVGVIPPKETIF